MAMTFIPEKEAGELSAYLEAHLTGPVTMDLFVRPLTRLWIPGRRRCDTCEDALKLLGEVASLSDKITLRIHDVSTEPEAAAAAGLDQEQVPAVVLAGAASGRARFLGLPAGLEFGTLLGSLIDVARGGTSLAEATKEALRALDRDVHIRVFVTPSCPFCPRAAAIAHQMAVESARVTADVVEAEEFPELAERYHVQGVPKVVLNETVEFLGAQPEARFLDHVLHAAA
jgi:glutaredoxin-like protein